MHNTSDPLQRCAACYCYLPHTAYMQLKDFTSELQNGTEIVGGTVAVC